MTEVIRYFLYLLPILVTFTFIAMVCSDIRTSCMKHREWMKHLEEVYPQKEESDV